ncbi:hypothetical protein ACEQPO_30305 [Bacillus sp. SL00103]
MIQILSCITRVDSSFIERATQDPDFHPHKQQAYAINKLMKEDEADIILLTCTQYIAALGDQEHLFKTTNCSNR